MMRPYSKQLGSSLYIYIHTHTHMYTRIHINAYTYTHTDRYGFINIKLLRQAYCCLYVRTLHSAHNKTDVGCGTQRWNSQIIKLCCRQLVCICPPTVLSGLFVKSLKFLFEQYVYPCEKNWQPKNRFWCCVGIKSPSLQ